MSDWIDITRPVDEQMACWPGRSPAQRTWEKRIRDGDHCNASLWELSAHCGTHVDAPLHFVEQGIAIDQVSPEVLIGECVVIEGDRSGERALNRQELEEHHGQKRILVRSGHSERSETGKYQDHSQLMTQEAALHLLDGGLVLIGTDRLSVDATGKNDFALHHILLEAGCVIVEGLALEHAPLGEQSLYILPLRLAGAEASPARAFLAPLSKT